MILSQLHMWTGSARIQRVSVGRAGFTLGLVLGVIGLMSGCTSAYVTPWEPANFDSFVETGGAGAVGTDAVSLHPIESAYAVQPAAKFPATVAMVRIQGTTAYNNIQNPAEYRVGGLFAGESEIDLDRVRALPGLRAFTPMSELLIGTTLADAMELRTAAARLHADMLLLYTFSRSTTRRDVLPPLSLVSLGMAPTRSQTHTLTASALLIDVRTGFVYSALQVMEDGSTLSNSWNEWEATDRGEDRLERRALQRLLDEFEGAWPEIVRVFGEPPPSE